MTALLETLKTVNRPRLLIRAARHGLEDYSRDRTLARLIGVMPGARVEETLAKLVEVEARMEQARKEDDGSYSVVRHIDLLVALIAESRLLPKPPAPDGFR